jgi:hypothetical protein
MPISSHCFWPWLRQAGRCAHAVGQVDGVQQLGDAVALLAVEARSASAATPRVGLERQFQVLEHAELLEHRGLLELAADAQLGDLGLVVRRSRSMVLPKNTVPLSGRVLPVMMSIIVVLPAPLGPMMQRSSPTFDVQRSAC